MRKLIERKTKTGKHSLQMGYGSLTLSLIKISLFLDSLIQTSRERGELRWACEGEYGSTKVI